MSLSSGGGLSREEYVRIICRGYLVNGTPIPEEFWDEWDAIVAKEARDKPMIDRLLEIEPQPMGVVAIMHDGTEFLLHPKEPAGISSQSFITLTGDVPVTGLFKWFQLRRPDGTVLAQFDGNVANVALVQGDSLHCTLDAEAMVKLLAG